MAVPPRVLERAGHELGAISVIYTTGIDMLQQAGDLFRFQASVIKSELSRIMTRDKRAHLYDMFRPPYGFMSTQRSFPTFILTDRD